MPHLLPRQLDAPGAAVPAGHAGKHRPGIPDRRSHTGPSVRKTTGSPATCRMAGWSAVVLWCCSQPASVPTSPWHRTPESRLSAALLWTGIYAPARRTYSPPETWPNMGGITYGIIPAATEQGPRCGEQYGHGRQHAVFRNHPQHPPESGRDFPGFHRGEATAEETAGGFHPAQTGPRPVSSTSAVTLRDGKVTGAILIGPMENFLPLKRLIDGGAGCLRGSGPPA